SKQLPDSLQFMLPLFSPFAGVFAFESVLKHANITVYGRGALTIEEWITKARDNAEARANAKEVQSITRERLDAAYKLKALPQSELTLQRHLIHFLVIPGFGGGVLRHLSSPLMLSNRRWTSISCLLGG